MADVVGMVLFAVLLPLGMWSVFRFSRRAPDVAGGSATLRLGPAVAVLGWVCSGIGSVMLGALVAGEMHEEPLFAIVIGGGVGLAFFVSGAWFLLTHRREYVRFSKEGVEGRGGLERAPTSLRWAEVERVEFSSVSGYLTLFGTDGRTVKVSALLHGSDDLASLLYQHARAHGVSEAVHLFRQYRIAYGGESKR